jgi:plastocyanin
MQKLHPVKLVRLFALLGLLGCGGTTEPDDFNGVTIGLTTDLLFAPADVTIDPGTSVRWVAAASIPHTITPDVPAQPGVWTAVNTSTAGTVLTHTFTVPGQTYSYTCQVHVTSGMTGIIRVR